MDIIYDTRRNTKRKRPPFERPLCKIALYCNIKPYLRSMSSMTDKEKKDLLNYVVDKGSKYFEVCDDVSITDKSSDVQDLKSFELKWINFNPNTNAACNIRDKGIEILVGNRIPELTLVENPLMDERSVMNLKSNDSLKQEVKTNFY